MSSKGFDVLIASSRRRIEYLENYMEISSEIGEMIRSKYEGARVYVFGSTVRGSCTASSDIDLLVVLPQSLDSDERAELRAMAFMRFPEAPLELHIVNGREFKEWYLKFVKNDELVEVL